MPNDVKPIFIFSLPRSGSTLLQRVLAAHERIATASEPWLLLPYLYSLRQKGVYAEYGHRSTVKAIGDFCTMLPNGVQDYEEEVRRLALRLYSLASKQDAEYFVDKTPRYALVANEIMRMFPKGTFIFLWRNPLAIAASIMNSWANGKWNLFSYTVDLFTGLENLVATYERRRDRCLAVRYEDFVANPVEASRRVFAELSLDFDASIVRSFAKIELGGRMGDAIGTRTYRTVNREPLEKWRQILGNPFRKTWCRRYLRWIGRRRLRVMGYDMDEILAELGGIPSSTRFLASDLIRAAGGTLMCRMGLQIVLNQIGVLPSWHRMHRLT